MMWIYNMSKILGVLVLTLGFCHSADWTHEGEHGVNHWPEMFDTCAGSSQSPINIDLKKAIYNSDLDDLDPITLVQGSKMVMDNNGHAVSLLPEAKIHMNGAGLGKVYYVHGPHFHWGSDSRKGSEHTVNGKPFPLEMHIVCYNGESFADVGDAVASGEADALAVFGVFFQIQKENNTAFQPIIELLPKVQNVKSKVDVEGIDIKSLLPQFTDKYYRYQGSLTTPTCNEVVVWTLFEEKVSISELQMEEFRRVLDSDGEPLVNNYRPVQKLNQRNVYKSFSDRPYDYKQGAVETDDPYGSANTINSSALLCSLTISFMLILKRFL